MNRTNIDWSNPQEGFELGYTWNPAVGCKHNCPYCYAKRINDRYHIIPDFYDPKFFEERLDQPGKVKKPSTVFVVSMGDLFGQWVPGEWIDRVLDAIIQYDQHRYMLLTKNPKRYLEFVIPKNCWIGTSLDYARHQHRLKWLEQYNNSKVKKFVSVEPILSCMHQVDFSGVDLVIVGAMTGVRATRPQKDWIYSIKHHNISYKENIKKYL